MPFQGYGNSITFESGFFAQIVDIEVSGMHRDELETTHTQTAGGRRTFQPSDLVDSGGLKVELWFEPNDDPPIDQDPETCTINWADGDTWACTAFMTDYEAKSPRDGLSTASATLKFSGTITINGTG